MNASRRSFIASIITILLTPAKWLFGCTQRRVKDEIVIDPNKPIRWKSYTFTYSPHMSSDTEKEEILKAIRRAAKNTSFVNPLKAERLFNSLKN